MNNANVFEVIPSEITRSIITQFASDIADFAKAEWVIAAECLGRDLARFYTLGRNSNPQACLREMHSALSREPRIEAAEPDPAVCDADSENWMPGLLCVVRVHGEMVAVIALGRRNAAEPYTFDDKALITRQFANVASLLSNDRMARRVGMQIARARRVTRELANAREVQQKLLPRNLHRINGLDYCGECQFIGELGGDFFDFIPIAPASLLVLIGDVSGKGVPSAILMAAIQGSLRAMVPSSPDFDIRVLVQRLNRMVWERAPDNFFVTMFCALIDVARCQMQFVT